MFYKKKSSQTCRKSGVVTRENKGEGRSVGVGHMNGLSGAEPRAGPVDETVLPRLTVTVSYNPSAVF